jgi:hypothetical protein
MVNHDVVGLYISMHDAFAVAEIQSLQKLIHVKAHIVVGETRVQGPKIGVVDVFENQTRRLALAVTDHIQQSYHIGTTRQILEDFDLTLDLLLLDRFEDLDDTLLVVDDIDALEHFGVLSPACIDNCQPSNATISVWNRSSTITARLPLGE